MRNTEHSESLTLHS